MKDTLDFALSLVVLWLIGFFFIGDPDLFDLLLKAAHKWAANLCS